MVYGVEIARTTRIERTSSVVTSYLESLKMESRIATRCSVSYYVSSRPFQIPMVSRTTPAPCV
jgi:hypothetical protein